MDEYLSYEEDISDDDFECIRIYSLDADEDISESSDEDSSLISVAQACHRADVEVNDDVVLQWKSIEDDRYCWYDMAEDRYWTMRSIEVLHWVDNVSKAKQIIKLVEEKDELSKLRYLTCRTVLLGATPLHMAVLRDRVDIAELIIKLAPKSIRDRVIFSYDRYKQTPLHHAESPQMVRTLILNLSPHCQQEFIKASDYEGLTVAHTHIIGKCNDVFAEIWRHSSFETQMYLFQRRDHHGDSLFMQACYWGDRKTVRWVIDNFIGSPFWAEALHGVNSYNGDTVIHQLIARCWTKELIDILKTVNLGARRDILAVKNDRQISPVQLLGHQPGMQVYVHIFMDFDILKGSEVERCEMRKIIHELSNQYNIISPPSVVHWQMNLNESVTHSRVNISVLKVSNPTGYCLLLCQL